MLPEDAEVDFEVEPELNPELELELELEFVTDLVPELELLVTPVLEEDLLVVNVPVPLEVVGVFIAERFVNVFPL